MTPLQACQETEELWTSMARAARTGIRKEKYDIPGPWQAYRFACPCCEIAFPNCQYCAMRKEWGYYTPTSAEISLMFCCESTTSPFLKWVETERKGLCIDVEFFCLLIADLAKEAKERIQKEMVEEIKVNY